MQVASSLWVQIHSRPTTFRFLAGGWYRDVLDAIPLAYVPQNHHAAVMVGTRRLFHAINTALSGNRSWLKLSRSRCALAVYASPENCNRNPRGRISRSNWSEEHFVRPSIKPTCIASLIPSLISCSILGRIGYCPNVREAWMPSH